MSKIETVVLDFDKSLEEHLKKKFPSATKFRILKKSLDARGAPRGRKPQFTYSVDIMPSGDNDEIYQKVAWDKLPPVVVGAGPAGLFCALRLLDFGIKAIVCERGKRADQRMNDISVFWKQGLFNSDSNVCFGAGGAGLFSDGKLNTRVKSKNIDYVMRRFHQFGADESVRYLSNPHLGTNKLRQIVNNIVAYLEQHGVQFYFETKVEDFIFHHNQIKGVVLANGKQLQTEHVILATGHSAYDIYNKLIEKNVTLTPKDFAVGVRIEHPREMIDRSQYGKFADKMEAATYKLTHHNHDNNRGTYSFCMCPGGMVVSSGSEATGIVTNGMSNSGRNSKWSNSALIVSVKAGIDFDLKLTSGMDYIRKIEESAYQISCKLSSGKELPAQKLLDFLSDKRSSQLDKFSSPSGVCSVMIKEFLPPAVVSELKAAMPDFNQKITNFISPEAIIYAPETRTSSPLQVTRKSDGGSISHQGLYPCGEGAGYAGGITSSALDGVFIAEQVVMVDIS